MSAYSSLDDGTDVKNTTVSPDSYPVVPSDTDSLPRPARALRANTAGVIHVLTAAGQERYMNFAATETRYVAVFQVFEEGTTAGGIEAMP